MKFFLLWIMTRLKEGGWPKARGLLRSRKVITEKAVIAATQDAIRIALTIGGSLPDVARAIAITCMDKPLTKKAVESWIDERSAYGDTKMMALSDVYPKWLRFCSIGIQSRDSDIQQCLWTANQEEYDYSLFINEFYKQSVSVAVFAMCWALKHPNEAQDLFHNPNALESIEPELQDLVSAPATYSGWLTMAKMLVSRYSEEEGLPKYEDLA